jgi:hypothetical protein
MPNAKRSKTKKKGAPPPAPIDPSEVLTKAQQYYIKGNMEGVPDIQIAADLGLTVALVRQYIRSLQPDTRTARTNRLLQRPARGVVAMTEAASMVADDLRSGGLITQAEINRASAAGNYELAADLVRRREEQQVDSATSQRARYGHCWHFIREPGSEPPNDRRR